MKVTLESDFPVTDAGCQDRTGKSLKEWFQAMDARGTTNGRREVISWLYNETGRGPDMWWPTTIWVEFERSKGVVNKKDGLAEGYHLCATKTVTATPEEVYAAWADSAKNGWLGCSAVVEGGDYSDDGGNSGTFLRLRPGKDVRIAWQTNGSEHKTMVDAVFADKGKGKTGITVNHMRVQTREEADGLRNAWGEALNRLKAQLEG